MIYESASVVQTGDEMARRVIQFIEKGHPLDEAVDIVKPRKRKEVVTTDVYQYRDSPCTMCGSFYGHWSNCGVSKP